MRVYDFSLTRINNKEDEQMKKTISISLAIMLVLAMAACAAPPAPAPAPEPPAQPAPAEPAPAPEPAPEPEPVLEGNFDLILATGGTGGTYYPLGGAMAQVFMNHLENVNVTAQSTGASAENARLLNSKEAELAILQNDVLDYAFNGTETMAEGGALKNIATIATLYPEVIHVVVSVESGINSIAEMKGKRISVGAAGSGTEANARQILAAHGLTYDDIDESFLSFAESATGIQNKSLDGTFITGGVPNPSVLELSSMVDVKLLTFEADKIAALTSQYPFYATFTVAEDAYESVNGGDTVAVLATLACSADLDENLVYFLTKTLFENQPELALGHKKGEELDLAKAVKGVSVPFHAGAERYFKEAGVM